MRIRTTRLTLAERQAATDSAAGHGVRRPAPGPPGTVVPGSSPGGGPIAYASGKMVSRVGGSAVELSKSGPFPGFSYGLFEIRCQLPASGRGILPAFWLNGPQTEIDIMDNCNENPGRLLQTGVLDWGKRTTCGGNTAPIECWTHGYQLYQYDRDLTQGFNTYSAVWTPEAVTFYLNDYYLYSVPAALVKTHREAVRLILDVGTRGEDRFNSGDMLVDYIRVWELR
ncbi:family 16 glycosylhydrolase [Hymenobacter sp. RP-2-7]|uniref:Family 16 glycosylhydrolase n=1 Tax=Hymenobacter polaris TaxID=2682546 RepID=A0A7Y0FNY8_9BACT|nr:family 16 glycosylhydrolase [Hymenobacter polaris]NML67020.1 family 16 glycosylhydrolase [Hymenobacter polaris]